MISFYLLSVAVLVGTIHAASRDFILQWCDAPAGKEGFIPYASSLGLFVLYQSQSPLTFTIHDDQTITSGSNILSLNSAGVATLNSNPSTTGPFTIENGLLKFNGQYLYAVYNPGFYYYNIGTLYSTFQSAFQLHLRAVFTDGNNTPGACPPLSDEASSSQTSSEHSVSEVSSSEISTGHSSSDTYGDTSSDYSFETSSEELSTSVNPTSIEISSTELLNAVASSTGIQDASSSSVSIVSSSIEISSVESSGAAASSTDLPSIATSSTESSSTVTSPSVGSSSSSSSGSSSGSESVSVSGSGLVPVSVSVSVSESGSISTSGSTESISSVVIAITDSAVSSMTKISGFTSSSALDNTLPTAPVLRNPAKLMGADLITDISLHDNSTGSDYANPHDFITLNVTVESTKPIGKGTIVQFSLPDVFYGNINPFDIYSTKGELVGTVSSDEANVFTITFDGDYGLTHTNIKGSFTFNIKLRYIIPHEKRDLLYLNLSHEIVQPFLLTTVSRDFVSYLIFNNLSSGEDAGSVDPGNVFVFIGDSSISLTITALSSTTPVDSVSVSGSGSTEIRSIGASSSSNSSSSSSSNSSSSSSSISGTTEASSGLVLGEGTETVTNALSTIVTITSCSDHMCHKTTMPATWGPVTTTLDGGEVTVYTTWCPESGAEGGALTTTITITSCSNNKCHEIITPATWGYTTTTLNDGEMSVYPAWCPVSVTTSAASTTIYKTVVCTENVCQTVTVTSIVSSLQTTLESTGTSNIGSASPTVSTEVNGVVKIGASVLALVVIPLAYMM